VLILIIMAEEEAKEVPPEVEEVEETKETK
jgi:hypothetical protein